MLTTRGWWIAFFGLLCALAGFLLRARGGLPLAQLGLMLSVWMFVEWVRFRFRVAHVLPSLEIEREFFSGPRRIQSTFPGQELAVRIQIRNPTRWNLTTLQFRDLVPGGVSPDAREKPLWFDVPAGESRQFEFGIRPQEIGILRFRGVSVRFADLQGFFTVRHVFRENRELPVLPTGSRRLKQPRVTKRFNTLPAPGVQRFLRPGGGGDLLDLRDYMPGDPPKMIAWKQTARRDKLITKELESEVPLRCTLFVEASADLDNSNGSKRPTQVLVRTAASIAEILLRNRDYVGLTCFDEQSEISMLPARTTRHRVEMLRRLAEAAQKRPISNDVEWLGRQSHALASEIYPELMKRTANRAPWAMYWEPLLDFKRAWLVMALIAAPLLFLFPLFREWLDDVAITYSWRDSLGLTLIIGASFVVLGLLIWLIHGLSGHWPTIASRVRRRKQMAALFVALDHRPASEIAKLREDDRAFRLACQKFLSSHSLNVLGNATPPPLDVPEEEEAKIDRLMASLMRSVAMAHDNELFVILGNFTRCEADWPKLFQAFRLIRSRHHEVVCICQRQTNPALGPIVLTTGRFEWDFLTALTKHYNDRVERFQKQVRRLGVRLLWAERDETVGQIVQRMADLRAARIHR